MKKAFLILLTAGLLLLCGCKDLTPVSKFEANEGQKAYLSFSKPQIENNVLSRTALPTITDKTLTTGTNLFLELTGNLLTDSTNTIRQTFDSLDELQSASIECEEGIWNFTLKASCGTGSNLTFLEGTLEQQQIISGNNELSFTLYWDRTNLQGTGSLQYNLSYQSVKTADDVKCVTAQLFTYDTVTKEEDLLSEYEEEEELEIEFSKVNFEAEELNAGNYRLKLYLYADENKEHLINTVRDLVIITGGQDSNAYKTIETLNPVYTITYNLNYDDELGDNQYRSVYTRFSEFDLDVPVRSGYTFSGWYDNSNMSGSSVYRIEKGTTGYKEYYAKWTKTSINVSIEQNQDLVLEYSESGTGYTFTVSGGDSTDYTWSVDGEEQAITGASFTFSTTGLTEGAYEIEVINGDLSASAFVSVTASSQTTGGSNP